MVRQIYISSEGEISDFARSEKTHQTVQDLNEFKFIYLPIVLKFVHSFDMIYVTNMDQWIMLQQFMDEKS